MSTKVKSPMTRHGLGYSTCTFCKGSFTRLGISRHWDHCKMNPNRLRGSNVQEVKANPIYSRCDRKPPNDGWVTFNVRREDADMIETLLKKLSSKVKS